MMTFMARLLHAPPSRFSRPSTVPLEVAVIQWWGDGDEEGGGDAGLREGREEEEEERR